MKEAIEDTYGKQESKVVDMNFRAVDMPVWDASKCVQCNRCSYVCPHAAIRPFLLSESEVKAAPESMNTKQAIGKGAEQYAYRIQVSTLNFRDFLMGEVRYNSLAINFPEEAEKLLGEAEVDARARYEELKQLAGQ